MSQDITLLTLLSVAVVILLALSAFYSFSEMALASSSRTRLKTMSREATSPKRKEKISKVIEFSKNYNESITSIVVFNNIINVLATTISTTVLTSIFTGGVGFAISFVLMTILIIVFGELLPKMLAKKYPEKGLLMFYPVLVITKTTLKPITFFFKRIIKQDDGSSIKSVSELKEAIDEISQFDHITTSEQKLLQKSLILDETPVKNKMIPIADMVSITPYSTEKTILSIIKESKFTRLPIVKNNKIIGVLNTKTLLIDLQSSTKADFKQLVSNNTFEIKEIKWTDSLSEAFTELRNARRHMASVVNSKNKTVGFITVEDIVESIVGQMYDETEYEKDGIFKISDSAYQLDSSANAYIFFNEYLNKKPPAIIKKTTTFKQFVSEIATDKNQEQIIYKNFIIWVKKDKIKKEVIFEVDTIQNEK